MMRFSMETELVAALLIQDGRVLMCHRRADRANWPGVWDFPGGHVEPAESVLEALGRELHEELGISVSRASMTPLVTLNDSGWVLHLHRVEEWTGDVRNAAPAEHSELRWVNRDEAAALRLVDPAYLGVIGDALSRPG